MERPARLLKPDEVEEILGTSRHTVVQFGIPHIQVGGSRRYRWDDLEPFLTETHVLDFGFRQTNPIQRCDLYFIRNIEAGRIKIGVATDTEKRRIALENGSGYRMETLGSVRNGSDLEGALHVVFRDLRHIGEWFNPSDEMVQIAKRPSRAQIMDLLYRKEAEGDIKLITRRSGLMAYPWKKR